MSITAKDLRIEIVEVNGRIFVADYGKGVKSEHPDRLSAECFVASIVNSYNNNIN